jgi:serine/threonine protein phosphatase PrpC
MVEKETSQKTTVTIAHVGDSRVVLRTSGKAVRLTRDHKGSDPDE